MSSRAVIGMKRNRGVLGAESQPNGSCNKWKSVSEQQTYASNLVRALRNVRCGSTQGTKRGRAICEATYRALAVSAEGRARWSRAILANNRVKLSVTKLQRPRVGAGARIRRKLGKKVRLGNMFDSSKAKNIWMVKRKTRMLGGLVPGCRKQPLPVVLEEAADYIAALQMQVRAMAALTHLLTFA